MTGGYNSTVAGAANGPALDALLSKIKSSSPATASAAGTEGLYPAAPAGATKKVYTSQGTWDALPDTSFITFMTAVKTVTTLAGLPGDAHSIIANVTAATNFTMTAPAAGREVMIRVNNTSAAAITQALPTTGVYQSMAGASVSIPANSFIEISVWSIGGKLVLRVGENA